MSEPINNICSTPPKRLSESTGPTAKAIPVSERFTCRKVRAWEQGVDTPSDMACRFMGT